MTTEYVDISLVRGPMGWGTDETLNIDTRLYASIGAPTITTSAPA